MHRQDEDGSVRLGISQAGVLQTFPADYPWCGTVAQRYAQIGNAIPPLLAHHLLEATL